MARGTNITSDLASTMSNTPPDSQYDVQVDEMVVNVFFDGTMNNLFNVNAGTPNRGTSYSNAHSNVSWMYQSVRGGQLAVYIQGIGTLRGEKDVSMKGAGLGLGKTGVVSRALDGFRKTAEALQKKYKKTTEIHQLTLNVFGFSRGAAAARYFVSELKTTPNAFRKHSGIDTITIANVDVNFMGLFDTVSSVGASPTNDAKSYKQQIRRGWATRVFHLVAGDEFRAYFPVTHIDTAIADGFGYELQIPGAHSDIGGGYPSDTEALRWTSHHAKGYFEHLTWWGWYRTDQIYSQEVKSQAPRYDAVNYGTSYWDHWTKARSISNKYHRVGLNIMAEMTKFYVDSDDLSFDDLPISTSDTNIQWLKETLTEYAKAGDRQALKHTHKWLLPRSDEAWARSIYNNYFHISARFFDAAEIKTYGMHPNIDGNGKPYREHVHDNQ